MTERDFRNAERDSYDKPNSYDRDIVNAERARNNQFNDTNPKIEKEGFLGMDDIDRLRRRKIGKIF